LRETTLKGFWKMLRKFAEEKCGEATVEDAGDTGQQAKEDDEQRGYYR
jgi:hypothetical protein